MERDYLTSDSFFLTVVSVSSLLLIWKPAHRDRWIKGQDEEQKQT